MNSVKHIHRIVRATALTSACAGLIPVSAEAATSSNTGININNFVGADRFYAEGYTGSRATVGSIWGSHLWNSHETLTHVTTFVHDPASPSSDDPYLVERATWFAGLLGGRVARSNPQEWQRGIAYGAEIWSGSVYTGRLSNGHFPHTPESDRYPYIAMMAGGVGGRTADVILSAWWDTVVFDNSQRTGRIVDALANLTGKTVVQVAGNTGPAGRPDVSGMGASYNCITVISLGTDQSNPRYGTRTEFAPYGPNAFWNPANQTKVPAVVAAVDLAAPGSDLMAAGYGDFSPRLGLTGSVTATPIVAGGAALVVDAGRALFPDNPHAVDGRVVKSVLQTSATKTPGWYNTPTRQDNVVTTTQGLDYYTGAGALNLNRAYTQYTAGTTDVPGLGGGGVQPVGWDFGEVAQDAPNDYYFSAPLLRLGRLTATLNWFMDNSYDVATDTLIDQSLDNLDLELWRVTPGADVPDVLVAQSISVYNNVEHLYLQVPETADYMLRVKWAGEVFDTVGDANRELFALSWSSTAVPEPAEVSLLAFSSAALFRRRRRHAVNVVARRAKPSKPSRRSPATWRAPVLA